MKGKRMIMETIQPLEGQIAQAAECLLNAGENTIVDMHTIFRKENGHA